MDDSLPVRFANTWFAERGAPRDLLDSVSGLGQWLSENDLSTAVTSRDIATFQALREVTRRVLRAVVDAERLPAGEVAALNGAAASAPMWWELVAPCSSDDLGVRAVARSAADPVTTTLGRLAGSVVELVAGAGRERVRACGGPGCVMFFEESRSRRRWCSAGCGNRARVARHYERTHRGPGA